MRNQTDKKNGNTLYLECYSGISGDMTVAALLDLGADQEELDRVLRSIPADGFETKISRVKKAGLDVCDFAVLLDGEHENHDHDMEYLYGHDHAHEHGHPHDHMHQHQHDHGHSHTHVHRGLPEILDIIAACDATEGAKLLAEKIFRILAEAESQAHGVPVEEVHFHEVGAVDSIVDILAVAVCLDNLEITQVIVPMLCEGRGSIRCQHGVIPVPVPAVANIAATHRIPLHFTSTEGELVTPTGAAIVAAVTTSRELPEQFRIRRVGLGAGKREYDRPGILRAMLIENEGMEEQSNALIRSTGGTSEVGVYMLETNIDDATGEELGYVMERLLEAGAGDVYYTPIYMKKNRPACKLSVICSAERVPQLEAIIFKETTTIGIRKFPVERTTLPREQRMVRTGLGEAEVKICTLPDGERRVYPEYRSVAELAQKQQMCYRDVYDQIRRECI